MRIPGPEAAAPAPPVLDAPPAGVLLTTRTPTESTAWSKARRDVGWLLARLGYVSMPLPASWNPREWLALMGVLEASLPAGGHVLIEYPFGQRKRAFVLRLLCNRLGAKLYALVHDLDSLRGEDSPVRREVAILKLFDGLISHSDAMTRWLREQGVTSNIVELGLFDYCATPDRSWHENCLSAPLKVACAGNLSPEKAGFVYDPRLSGLAGVELSLYGPNFEPARLHAPLTWLGVFDPDRPALQESCHFGLVWDGHDVDGVDGAPGRYMLYNAPHKLSLYLALGLPVVVWSDAAASRFVRDHGIGVAVRSLRELSVIPARLTPSDYCAMAASAVALGQEVRRGAFLSQALRDLA